MNELFININGTKLFYVEKNAEGGDTIFFFHGNSSSHRTWQQQLSSEALSKYRIVAFDLPAHGLSDSASTTTDGYSLPSIAKLMAKAVEQLAGKKSYLLAGVSLGTNIIAEMMALNVKPAGLVLAGPCIVGHKCPLEKMMKPFTAIGVGFKDAPLQEELQAWATQISGSEVLEKTNFLLEDYNRVKDGFRSKIGHSVEKGIFSDQVSLIKETDTPVLIIFGSGDQLIYSDYLDKADLPLWKNKIIKLDGAGHWVHLDKPESFNQLLIEFASDIFTKACSL